MRSPHGDWRCARRDARKVTPRTPPAPPPSTRPIAMLSKTASPSTSPTGMPISMPTTSPALMDGTPLSSLFVTRSWCRTSPPETSFNTANLQGRPNLKEQANRMRPDPSRLRYGRSRAPRCTEPSHGNRHSGGVANLPGLRRRALDACARAVMSARPYGPARHEAAKGPKARIAPNSDV